jgi:hypothetical protein
MLPDKVYNVLKIIVQYVLPASASLYFGLSRIWNLPYSDQIVGTIMAFDAFLGAILGISLVQYNKQTKYVQSYMRALEASKRKNIFSMSTTVYNVLYWIVQVVLPAIATLYFALGPIWQLPYVEEIVATIALIDTFMGVFLGISTNQYNKAKQEILS